MKCASKRNVFLTAIYLLLTCNVLPAQDDVEICNHTSDVLNRMHQLHYQPVLVDVTVKKEMIDLYIDDLDKKVKFFSAEDVERIKSMAGEELCKAYMLSRYLYRDRVQQYDSLVKVILAKPLDFTSKDVLVYSSNKKERFAEKDRRAVITKQLKYKLLTLVYTKLTADSTDLTTVKKLSPALEKEMREKLVAREEILVKRLNAGHTHERLSEIFLNAVVTRYDPHSSYFSEQTKNSFEESLSKDNRSFGLGLSEDENFEIVVLDILPGSPAWISSQVHEQDIVESVTDQKGVTYELQNMGMDYFEKIIDDPANESLTFNLRNKSNERTKVTLIKARVENTENSFRGYILSDAKMKLGYVPLPSFYTNFESDQQLGCANDVAKEILLLKKENIHGLILDLRDNGGGSLKEAIEIAGLFIDEGPLGAIKMKAVKPYLLKDFNRGTVYDGPLVIMVNGLSASASEFLSGCLQDYGRAVIIGDETYGKGTAQAIFEVDTMASLSNAYAHTFLKVTDGKFYHVSQRSNQARGIRPEVFIPNLYSSLEFFKEANQPYHLPNDSVAKKMMYKKMELPLTAEAKAKTQQRINEDPVLKKVVHLADSLNVLMNQDRNIPLEFAAFIGYSQKLDRYYHQLEAVYKTKTKVFNITNHSFAHQLLQLDEAERSFNQKVMEEMYFDPELSHTFLMFEEMIKF